MICFVCTLFANLALMHCWLMFASPLLHVWCILLCRALPEHWRVPTALESSETARKLDVPSAMFDIEQENKNEQHVYFYTFYFVYSWDLQIIPIPTDYLTCFLLSSFMNLATSPFCFPLFTCSSLGCDVTWKAVTYQKSYPTEAFRHMMCAPAFLERWAQTGR